MNERIKELAEQAGYKLDMFGVGHWDMPECKKFADLIVQECMRVVVEGGEMKQTAHYYRKRIKEHFGIKE